MLTVYETGFDYPIIHSIGLIVMGIVSHGVVHRGLTMWAGTLLCCGIVLFLGSLYVLSVPGMGLFGAITPVGALCFLAGWLLLALAVLREQPP